MKVWVSCFFVCVLSSCLNEEDYCQAISEREYQDGFKGVVNKKIKGHAPGYELILINGEKLVLFKLHESFSKGDSLIKIKNNKFLYVKPLHETVWIKKRYLYIPKFCKNRSD